MIKLFLLLLFVGVALTGLVESWGRRSFWPKWHDAGLRVYRETLPLPEPDLPPGSVFETKNGRFKVIGRGQCLFHQKSRGLFDTDKWFNLKGSLQWTEGRAMAVARIPVYLVLHYVLILILMAVFGLTLCARSYGTMGGVVSVLIGWAFVGGWLAFSAPRMKRVAERILAEYENYVARQHGSMDSRFQSTAVTPR
jgi:hypothetical protein